MRATITSEHPKKKARRSEPCSNSVQGEVKCVYIHAFETGSELRAGLTWWIDDYNTNRPHSALAGATPDEAYGQIQAPPIRGSPRIGLTLSADWRRNLKLNRP